MKVRCIRILSWTGEPLLDEKTGSPVMQSPWLTVGRVYRVLAVAIDERNIVEIRMFGDGGPPAIFRLSEFELVSGRLPSNWAVRWDDGCALEMAPERWFEPGFWDEYFDGDKDAVAVFEEEYRRIADEDP